MAKRKKKKTNKASIEITIELYAILLILVAILGIGKFGPVGRLIASFGLFLTGSIYLVTLFILFVIGIYVFFKREWPEFFSTKMFGFYLFVIGFLTLMHWEFVSLNSGNTSMIFKETINQLIKGFNVLMSSGGISSDITVGGGIIGGVFLVGLEIR